MGGSVTIVFWLPEAIYCSFRHSTLHSLSLPSLTIHPASKSLAPSSPLHQYFIFHSRQPFWFIFISPIFIYHKGDFLCVFKYHFLWNIYSMKQCFTTCCLCSCSVRKFTHICALRIKHTQILSVELNKCSRNNLCVPVHLSACMHHYLVTATLTGDQCRHTMQNKLSAPLGLNKWLLLSLHLNAQKETTKICCSYYPQKRRSNQSTNARTPKKKIDRNKDKGGRKRTSIQITVNTDETQSCY